MSLTFPILFIFGLLSALPASGEDRIVFVEPPLEGLDQAQQVLDAADLRVMLPLGFALNPDLEGASVLVERTGVIESRIYLDADGKLVEIALVVGLEGFELALYSNDGEVIKQVQTRLTKLVRRSQAQLGKKALGYEMYRLGYIEADQALSILKALGYNTIEFAPAKIGREDAEGILDLVQSRGEELPWVIKVVNASKTSLLEIDPEESKSRASSAKKSKNIEGAPQLGGSHLHEATGGAPEERLLLVYDRDAPEALERLVNLLQTHIDLPARQIVIEALVIEANTSRLRDLGVEFSSSKDNVQASFQQSANSGSSLGTLLFSRNGFGDFTAFRGALEALAESGDAEILSSPSVLVLNDRQARIQVGRQIPVARTTSTTAAVTKGIEYFPIGIVLNLRPRINRENTEVTLQIETIISSISPESAARLESSNTEVEFSPIIDNRLVETYVRVADGTPFIIGGLLSSDRQETRVGIPVLGNLPLLGRLFSRERIEVDRREVIVVLTPHIVPLQESSFSYLIPKDSKLFDRFDTQLFRNAYRVRDDDVWDLSFVRQSQVVRELLHRVRSQAQANVLIQRQEPFRSLLEGSIPGEDILVRRMMSDIVGKLNFAADINTDRVFFFEAAGTDGGEFIDQPLNAVIESRLKESGKAVLLRYEARTVGHPERPFTYPVATVTDTLVPTEERAFARFLQAVNPTDADNGPLAWTIVLADQEDVRHLRQTLVLKRLLELNSNLSLSLQAFRPGMQILFPTREDMRSRYHLIDRDVARLFYETSSNQYYPAFERAFNRQAAQIEARLQGIAEGRGE